MIGRKEIETIKEKIAFHGPPVLSMYVDVDPSKPENVRKGWLLRAKNTLKELDIPSDIESEIYRMLDASKPEGKTYIIFAAHFFEQYLARSLRDKIVAHLASLLTLQANSSEVGEKTFPEIERIEREKELELLRQIREQPGLWGLSPVLEALQLGRLHIVALPWNLDVRVWRCTDKELVFADEATAKMFCNEKRESLVLRDVIIDLASNYGTRLKFVRGEAADILERQMDGIAGITRW
ncbi:MAG: hypothetical protein JRK26_07525 [Deltaproteobacteria bacterium]|nr:hypothetical protein [Deltaproteobacteria bacterium]